MAEGKIMLHEMYPTQMESALREIGKTIHNLSTQCQTRALHCLELLFTTNEEQPNNLERYLHMITFLTNLNFSLFIRTVQLDESGLIG